MSQAIAIYSKLAPDIDDGNEKCTFAIAAAAAASCRNVVTMPETSYFFMYVLSLDPTDNFPPTFFKNLVAQGQSSGDHEIESRLLGTTCLCVSVSYAISYSTGWT